MRVSAGECHSILVTGGCGFIGSNFIRYLYHLYPHARITNLDLLTYAGNPENLRDIETDEAGLPENKRRYTFIQGDVANEATLESIFGQHRFDTVFHFAAESHVDRSICDTTEFVRTNIEGTRALTEAIRKYGVPRFIHISTDEVYGSIETGYTTEDAPLKPSNPYSASKAGADLLLQAYMRTHQLPAIIVRGSNNYGPYQYPEKLIPMSITNILEGEKVPIHGDGQHVRSWLHVHDFCRAIDTITENAADHKIYNVSGEEKTNLEVLAVLAKHLGKNLDTVKIHVSDRPGADRRYAPDSTALQKELGWSRLHSFDEAIGEIVRWYQDSTLWWKNIRLKKGFSEQYEKQANGRWA